MLPAVDNEDGSCEFVDGAFFSKDGINKFVIINVFSLTSCGVGLIVVEKLDGMISAPERRATL